ncbi:MAG: hypothetical protein ACRD3Q_19815 [Terriglobales bacterium]
MTRHSLDVYMKLSRPRTIVLICVASCAILAVLLMSLPGIRHKLLRAAGWALIANDEKGPVDVIVIGVDDYGGGVLEAADLVKEGIATRVAVFEDHPDTTDREFMRRDVPHYDAAALSVRQLNALGITSVAVIHSSVSGTNAEAALLPKWCVENGYHSVLMVTSPDHSYRVRRVLRRAMEGSGIDIRVRASRYSKFDPDRWWYSRVGVRTEVVESEKLLLDLVTHP